ncbi:MAG: lipopolysaccharide assembly protein LapA domain-containing protein [Magnetospirillum sp.]|nr:lipopolysaccharide assembly protein LapA domain-containing protein [Magnetospirillum sp.]
MRLVGWLLALPLSLLAVVFAVANRHDLRLELWPLPWNLDLPAYLAVLGPLVLGLALGALLTWLAGHRTRMAARTQRRRAESLERQLTATGSAQLPPPAPGQG